MGWLTDWTHRVPISFDRSAIATATRPVIALLCDNAKFGWDGVVAADLSNLRVTGADGTTLWDWCAEFIATSAKTLIHTRPAATLAGATAGTVGFVYWRSAAAVTNASEADTFQDCFARYGLAEAAGHVMDGTANNYDSTVETNLSYQATDRYGLGAAMELNGSDSVATLADITQLNSAAAFTIYFWLSQDVLGQQDIVFEKSKDATNVLRLWTNTLPAMACVINNAGTQRGEYNYTGDVSAGAYFHVAFVFDGAGADNAARLKLYINGAQKTLTYTGTIPATTAALGTFPVTFGRSTLSFDGKVDEARFFGSALSANDVLAAYGAQATGAAAKISLGSVQTLGGVGDQRWRRYWRP